MGRNLARAATAVTNGELVCGKDVVRWSSMARKVSTMRGAPRRGRRRRRALSWWGLRGNPWRAVYRGSP